MNGPTNILTNRYFRPWQTQVNSAVAAQVGAATSQSLGPHDKHTWMLVLPISTFITITHVSETNTAQAAHWTGVV